MKYNYFCIYQILSSLGDLYEDGMPMHYSFELLEELSLLKKYKKSIKLISENIKLGETVSKSFEKTNIYPRFMIKVMQNAEDNGNLSEAFNNLSSYYFSKYTIRKRIISAISYPLFLVFLLNVFMFFLIFVFLPQIYEAFIDIQNQMPEILKVLYDFVINVRSFSFIKILIYILSVISIITALAIILIKSGCIKKIFYKSKFGIIYVEYKFIIFLKMVMNSGSPVSAIIKMDLDYLSIGINEREKEQFIEGIKKGTQISLIFSKYNFISTYTLGMIKIGESRGKLSESINTISNHLENQINKKLNKIAEFIQPVFICFVAAIVIAIIISLVGPILSMMDIKEVAMHV